MLTATWPYTKSNKGRGQHLGQVHPGHRPRAQRVGEHVQQHRPERQPARQLARHCAEATGYQAGPVALLCWRCQKSYMGAWDVIL